MHREAWYIYLPLEHGNACRARLFRGLPRYPISRSFGVAHLLYPQTFCTRCLFRSLDHSQTCPLCRQNLPGYDYFQQHPCNKVILAISTSSLYVTVCLTAIGPDVVITVLKAFPDEYAERGATIEAEERDARLDTPIFVCQLSFPGIPTMLHFFEPRSVRWHLLQDSGLYFP